MVSPLPLPPELLEFIRSTDGQIVVLRGSPGTGRTMCGQSILNERRGHRILVDSRVSGGPTRATLPTPGRGRATEILRIGEPFGPPPSPPAGTTEPSRTSTPRSAVTAALPPGLAAAWEQIPDDRPSTVLFDSWDSFYSDYLEWAPTQAPGATSTDGAERRLLRALLRPGMLLIVVNDREAPGRLEYEADAVLVTRVEFDQGRPERWLSIAKLRRVEIRQSEYPFTLWGGRFQCVPPLPADFRLPTRPVPEDPTPIPGSIWPGSPEFARAFGRLPLGGISLIETDPDVPVIVWGLVALPFAAEVFRRGGRFCFVPPSTLLKTGAWVEGLGMFPLPVLARQLRVLAPAPDIVEPPELRSIFLPLREGQNAGLSSMTSNLSESSATGISPSSIQPRFPSTTRFVNEHPTDAPNGVLLSIDGLVSCARQIGSDYTPESLPTLVQSEVADQRNHIMVVGRVDDPLSRSLHSSAVLHLRILSRKGRYFLHGVRPMGPNHVLTPSSSEEGAQGMYALLPIV